MNPESQLALKEQQLSVHREQPPSPSLAMILQGVVTGGVTPENVSAVEKIVAMMQQEKAQEAARAFTVDMVRLKKELQRNPVKASKIVPNDDGSARYTFAPIEEIDAKLSPIALDHGFTYTFSELAGEPGKVTKVCCVTHVGGHSVSNPCTVRVGKGPPKSSECQGDGAAGTYAKRQALLDAFGIIAEKDTDGADPYSDARMEGHPITQVEADQLRELCDETKSDRTKFLDFAGAARFEDITSSRLADCLRVLNNRKPKQ